MPSGRRLYSANFGSDNVSGFDVAANGALSAVAGSPFMAGEGPFGIFATPDERYLYAANVMSNDISGFSVGANGALSPVPGSPFPTGETPDFQSVAIIPNQGPVAAFSAAVQRAGGQTRLDATGS